MNTYLKLWIKRVIWTLAVTAILCFIGAAVFYWELVRPIQKYTTLIEAKSAGHQIDPKELREVANDCIRWGSFHDAFITLIEYGDQSSVPLLIRSLHRIPDSAGEDGAIVCTYDHCQEALMKITGQDFGFDADAWEKWWKSQWAAPRSLSQVL